MKFRIPQTRSILLLWALAVATVILGSLLPATTLAQLHYGSVASDDKLVHFMGYTVLAIVPVAFLELLGIGIMLAVSMIPLGVLLEYVQRLVPGRSFEIADMAADCLGVMAGMVVALCIRHVLKRFRVMPAQR